MANTGWVVYVIGLHSLQIHPRLFWIHIFSCKTSNAQAYGMTIYLNSYQ
jgi:hypothetical protein